MKRFKLVLLALLIGLSGWSQIPNRKFPKLNTNKNLLNTKTFTDDQLKAMKPDQLAKLPAAKVDRGKLMLLKPTATYKIEAPDMEDKDLKITSLFGRYYTDENKFEIHPRFVEDNRNGFSIAEYMTLKFRPQLGKRYRLLLKLEPGNYSNNRVFIGTTGEYGPVSPWTINDQYDEVLMDFEATHNGLRISNIYLTNSSNILKLHQPLKIKSITLEKVE